MEIHYFDAVNKPTELQKRAFVDFLFEHLEEYGDPKEHILKCVDYALKEFMSFGGFFLSVVEEGKMLGATVINQTGMGGYIPENILVYIAVDKQARGRGVGKQLMERAIQLCKGDIALHVEASNPAKGLYEKMGFTNPYLEMRLSR